MPYIVVLIILAGWAFFALRHQPLRHYAAIFFVGGLIAWVAEMLIKGLLGLFEKRVYFLPGPQGDAMLTMAINNGLLEPTIAMIYARYCRRHPVLYAFLGAAGFGLLEVFFYRWRAILYTNWNPAFTVVAFTVFFLIVWRIHVGEFPVPTWMHVLGMSFMYYCFTDVLLSGGLGLWEFRIPLFGYPIVDDRVVGFGSSAVVLAPLATAWALSRERRRGPAAAALVVLLLLEAGAAQRGLLVYHGWSLWWSGLRYLAGLVLTTLYARWVLAVQIPEGERRPLH